MAAPGPTSRTVASRALYTCSPADNSSLGPLATAVLPRIFRLYDLSARSADYEVYRGDATFEDPLMKADGVKQIKSAFYSMVKVFSAAGIKEYSVAEAQTSDNCGEVTVDNVQHYELLGRDVDIVSQIRLTVEDGVVTKHVDLWNKKPFPTGAYGAITRALRRGSMLCTHALMGFGKDLPEVQNS